MELIKELGRRIQKARKEKGLTQQELADLSHVSLKHVQGCERGVKNPSFEVLRAFCKVLNGADRFCYSIKSSSMSSNRFGGNLISYCSFASARTSGRLSFIRFFSQEICSFDNRQGRFSKRFTVICSACFSGDKEAQDLQMCAA